MGFLLPLKTQIYELQNVLLHISRTFVEKNTTPPPKQQNNLLSIKQDFPTITVPGTENSACLAHSHTTGGKLSNSHQLIRFRSGMWLGELQGGWRVKQETVLMIQAGIILTTLLKLFLQK